MRRRLFGGIDEVGEQQARQCSAMGGLGGTAAEDVALAAYVASRVQARPKVLDLSMALVKAGLLNGVGLMGHYDARTMTAVEALAGTLDREEAEQIPCLIQSAAEVEEQAWNAAKRGVQVEARAEQQVMEWTMPELEEEENILPETERALLEEALRADPDEEGRQHGKKAKVALQHELRLLNSNTSIRRLVEKLQEAGDGPALRRLQELRDKSTCHTWLWHIDPRDGTVLA